MCCSSLRRESRLALARAVVATSLLFPAVATAQSNLPFVRGDCNGDGEVSGDVSDSVSILHYLFLGEGEPGCLKACDVDDDSSLDITDAVQLLSYTFLGGSPPSAPFPECGSDPTEDGTSCARSPCVDGPEPALLSSWLTLFSDQLAQVVEQTGSDPVTTWPAEGLRNTSGSQDEEVFADVQAIQYSDDWVYVSASGLASHLMGPWYFDEAKTEIFGNWPIDQNTIRRFPRVPEEAGEKETNGLGALGSWVNGVPVFNLLDGFSYSNADGQDVQGGPDGGGPPNGGPPDGGPPGGGPPGGGPPRGGDALWVRNAMLAELVTFDSANAHQPPTGDYHYHASPGALRLQLDDHVSYDEALDVYSEDTSELTHSPILGWSFDGYPIYGPYAYSDASDASSEIRRMVSGFVLRDGASGTVDLTTTGRTRLAMWSANLHETDSVLSEDVHGPDVNVDYPLGWYIEDYAYLGDLGFTQGEDFDLNIYNGRFCITPEFPEGTFAYFVAIDEIGEPAFPYVIGREWFGVVGGGDVTSIDEGVEVHFSQSQ